MQYPSDIDSEVVPLCDVLNSLPGIETTYSCSGHGEFSETNKKFHVFIECQTVEAMNWILKLINPRRYTGRSSPDQKGSKWKASAYNGHEGSSIIVLDLSPLVTNTAAAIDAAADLIEEIRWVQRYGWDYGAE